MAVHGAGPPWSAALRYPAPLEVPKRAREAGEQLVRTGAGLEAPRDGLAGGAHVVGSEGLEELAPAPQDAQMRAVDLVGRADEVVGPQSLDVDGQVRCGMDGIDPQASSDIVDHGRDRRDWMDGADGVGGEAHGHEARPRP